MLLLVKIFEFYLVFESSIDVENHETITNFKKDFTAVKESCEITIVAVVSNKGRCLRIRRLKDSEPELHCDIRLEHIDDFVATTDWIRSLNILILALNLVFLFHLS